MLPFRLLLARLMLGAGVVGCFSLPAANGADWPRWRGSNHDGISTETGLLPAWGQEGPPRLWESSIGAGYSSVAVVDGRVLTMDRVDATESIRCLDVSTGKELWATGYPCSFECEEGNGPRGTPTIDGNRVYTVGAANVVHCCDLATGTVLWKRDLLADFKASNMPWGTATSPLVDGSRLYVIPGGTEGTSIAALDKHTGVTVWSSLDDRAGYSSPIPLHHAGRPMILFFTATALSSIDPATGNLLFRFPWETQFRCNIATPIVADGRVFISSDYDQGCALVEIVAAGAGLEAKEIYRNKQMNNHFSSCVLAAGKLYGFHKTFLSCLDFATGKKEWTTRGFGRGAVTIADGKLIIFGEQGKVALAEPNPERYQEISSFAPFEGRCWAAPVVSNGRLYLRGPSTIECRDLRAEPTPSRDAPAGPGNQ